LEEAGRAPDTEIAGFFTHFWNACLRMFIGSVNQLGPTTLCQNNEHPFPKAAYFINSPSMGCGRPRDE